VYVDPHIPLYISTYILPNFNLFKYNLISKVNLENRYVRYGRRSLIVQRPEFDPVEEHTFYLALRHQQLHTFSQSTSLPPLYYIVYVAN
jgi:hypothetical protein